MIRGATTITLRVNGQPREVVVEPRTTLLDALRDGRDTAAREMVDFILDFTAYARDVVRGVSRQWVRNLYRFAVKPNLAFYFRVPLEVAIGRILGGRDAIKYYEAGMDLGLSRNIVESFRLFQGRILEEYDAMAAEMGFHIIDATGSIEKQQQQMRDIVDRELGITLPASSPRPETRA